MAARTSFVRWREPLLAILLAGVLSLGWVLRDWGDLSRLHLPDTDDAMRLQQIRDWLGGQAFADLAQHRLGAPPGLEMHWSRLPDLVPGAIIAALTPVIGEHAATLAALIAWPAMLFAGALTLTGEVARRLGAPAFTAILVAGLAYPATSVFLPGRIDHHGLQLLLVLVLLRALIGTGRFRDGAVASLAIAASLVIGLETAPLLAVGGAAVVLLWVFERPGAQARLFGLGIALPLALSGVAVVFRTSGWAYPSCDGFTGKLWRVVEPASFAPLALALFGMAGRFTRRSRFVAAGLAACGVVVLAILLGADCLDPYGAVDPVLARAWLARVGEAQPLFGAPPANALAYGGLAAVGLGVTAAIAWRRREEGWWIVVAFLIAAFAVTLMQLRGAYAGALLAAPGLSVLIGAARLRGALALAGAWILSTGILYPIAAERLFPARGAPGANCTGPEGLARLAALPPGRLIAPVDLGAYAIAGTSHRVVAAPYHRNNRGNRAMYDFFMGNPAASEAIARSWGVDYVAFCRGDLDRFVDGGAGAQSLAAQLRAGAVPAWLAPVDAGDAPRLYRLVSRD